MKEKWTEIEGLEICDQVGVRDKFYFENKHCEFVPDGWIKNDGLWFPLAYKLVTIDMESLGLRNNPTPMNFPIGEWVFEKRNLQYGKDFGGIWTALRKSSINTLRKHCMETWGMETKAFLTGIYNPVYANSYRIKSQGVILLKEI